MTCAPARLNNSLRVELTLTDCDGTAIDVSGATLQQVILRGPSIRLVTTSTFITDGTDGQIRADIDAGLIAEVGTWQVQGKVNLPGTPTLEYTSDIDTFEVEGNL